MKETKIALKNEIIVHASLLIGLLLLGYAIGKPWLLFSIGLLICLFWHLRQLARLITWLTSNELDIPPNAYGLWDNVFRQIYHLQKQNKQRQQKLTAVLNSYKEPTEAMPDAAIILTKEWKIEWLNTKCKSYFALQKKRDRGKILTHLIRNPILLSFIENHKSKKNNHDIVEINSPDQQKTLSIQLIPYKNKFLLTARDVSHIKKLKTMRQDFVANVSHELRTPLSVIIGYLETLEDCFQKEPMYADAIQLMQQQSQRMFHIIEDLLLLSKIESKELKKIKNKFIDMPELLSTLNKEALALSNKEHIIETSCCETKWLKGDRNEIQSAFSNIISNAIRYTPSGGKITIRWMIDGNKKGCFEVEDNGEGIAEQHIERLTERFYRADVGRSREIGGTGLGLAIVKHVIQHHQGKLIIHSTLGSGSVFRCEFPEKMLKK